MALAGGLRVSDVLDRTARAHGDQPALKHKVDGLWQALTWREYREQARLVAKGLMVLGLQPGQGVSILGANCPQWFLADVGAILAGGVPAGIYTTSSAEQAAYITGHCEAPVTFVDDARQLQKVLEAWPTLPGLRHAVLMHGSHPDPRVLGWEELLQKGRTLADSDLDARIERQTPDDVCTLIYTSGTTGQPKAVMISHDNVTWTASVVVQQVEIHAGDCAISYLPLSHVAEQMLSIHGPMMVGASVSFAESLDRLGENLREVRPHYFLGVPRVWEKMQARMMAAGAESGALKKKLVAWARGVGLQGGYAIQENRPLPSGYNLAKKLVFRTVREKLGLDRCRFAVTAAAPISKSTLEFFLSLGLPIYEVYGMSECTGPATLSLPSKWRTGKAGWVLPGGELKIAEDGEICMRGRHVFKGYLKDPEATRNTLDADGWLHSGDVGTIDADGFLQITDRKKDLLITAGGENVPPQMIEGLLKGIPGVLQAVVVGDARKYLSALLVLDPERLPRLAQEVGSPARDLQAARTCDKLRQRLQSDIDAVNARLAQVQTVKRWTLLPNELTIDGGELTPTMKVKRKVVAEKYAKEIEALYA